MIHTITFKLRNPLPILQRLHELGISFTRANRIGEPGIGFTLDDYPFMLIGRVDPEIRRDYAIRMTHATGRQRQALQDELNLMTEIFKIQLSLDDRHTSYDDFVRDVETIFQGDEFDDGQAQLLRIDYHLDLPISLASAYAGLYFADARMIRTLETTSRAKQITIGDNPCLTVYDRGRRVRQLNRFRPNAYPHLPEGPLTRIEARYERATHNGVQVLPATVANINHPRELMPHAREILARRFNPFMRAQYFDALVFNLPELPSPSDRLALWRYAREIAPQARIYGMFETVGYQRARGYCLNHRTLRSVFNRIHTTLNRPYDLNGLMLSSISNYFRIYRRRVRPTPPPPIE